MYNNTYGIKVISEEQYQGATHNFSKPGGARDKIIACRDAVAKLDAGDEGDVNSVNAICADSDDFVNNYVEGVFFNAAEPRGYYDIAHVAADPFPPEYYVGYLAKADVQQAIGVPINFTESIGSVNSAFVGK